MSLYQQPSCVCVWEDINMNQHDHSYACPITNVHVYKLGPHLDIKTILSAIGIPIMKMI